MLSDIDIKPPCTKKQSGYVNIFYRANRDEIKKDAEIQGDIQWTKCWRKLISNNKENDQRWSISQDVKEVFTFPVYKKGSKSLPDNYRLITFTCVSCKSLELIICRLILIRLECHKISISFQHLFHSGLSCESQVYATVNFVLIKLKSTLQFWTLKKYNILYPWASS